MYFYLFCFSACTILCMAAPFFRCRSGQICLNNLPIVLHWSNLGLNHSLRITRLQQWPLNYRSLTAWTVVSHRQVENTQLFQNRMHLLRLWKVCCIDKSKCFFEGFPNKIRVEDSYSNGNRCFKTTTVFTTLL